MQLHVRTAVSLQYHIRLPTAGWLGLSRASLQAACLVSQSPLDACQYVQQRSCRLLGVRQCCVDAGHGEAKVKTRQARGSGSALLSTIAYRESYLLPLRTMSAFSRSVRRHRWRMCRWYHCKISSYPTLLTPVSLGLLRLAPS